MTGATHGRGGEHGALPARVGRDGLTAAFGSRWRWRAAPCSADGRGIGGWRYPAGPRAPHSDANSRVVGEAPQSRLIMSARPCSDGISLMANCVHGMSTCQPSEKMARRSSGLSHVVQAPDR